MWYEYRCVNCRDIYETQRFSKLGRTLDEVCGGCGGDLVRIVSSPQVTPSAPDAYWNYTTGSVVTSSRDFERQLKLGAERMSERLGYEQHFTPVYPSEKNAYTESTANNDGAHGESIEKYSRIHNVTNSRRTIIT